MAGIRIQGFVHVQEVEAWRRGKDEAAHRVYVLPYRSSETSAWGVCVGEIDVEHQLPAGLDLKAEAVRQEIAALQRQRAAAGRKFAEEIREVDERLAKLQALEYSPAAEPELGR